MPDDASGKNEERRTQHNSDEAEPVIASAPPDRPDARDAESISQQNVTTEIHGLEDRIRGAEKWMIGLTAAIVLLTAGIVVVGILQWKAMVGQQTVMQGQLEEMKSGSKDTHALAVAAGTQAEASKELAALTGKQFTASQRLVESQRASISVGFASVLNPVTFHDGALSFAFSVTMKSDGRLPANKVKVRHQSYFSQWEKNIFSEPMERQSDFCSKPNISRDSRVDLRGLTNEDALTIVPGDAKVEQINFGTAPPTGSDIIKWPPDQPNQTQRVYPIVVGCVDYQSGAMTEPHQTGFIFEIKRGDPRMPTFITFGEAVRREDVIVEQYFFGQGKSY